MTALPVAEQRAVTATLQGLDPGTRDNLVAFAHARPAVRTLAAASAALELTMLRCWQDLTEATAHRYAVAALSVARIMRKRPRREGATAAAEDAVPYPCVGPWVLDRFLGRGGTGAAYLAHDETGRTATVKIGSYVEALTAAWLGSDLPDAFLAVIDSGLLAHDQGRTRWVAREYAPGPTWTAHCTYGGRPSRTEALELVRTACRAVDGLHQRRVFGWSSHGQNVLWDGTRWRLSDLHRSVIVTSGDDPANRRFLDWLRGRPVAEQACVLDLFGNPTELMRQAGIAVDLPDLERRLRLDDCAALGGFVLDAFGLNRWEVFFQALNRFPSCSGHYRLTRDPEIDRRLSAVLNRAWRGDVGGALLVANVGRGGQSTYSDPGELWDDVADVFGRFGDDRR